MAWFPSKQLLHLRLLSLLTCMVVTQCFSFTTTTIIYSNSIFRGGRRNNERRQRQWRTSKPKMSAFRQQHPPFSIGSKLSSTSPLVESANGDSDIVELLLNLIDDDSYSKKTPKERKKILELMKQLEKRGMESRYLDDKNYIGTNDDYSNIGGTLQWDSYELKYFDRSIDGGRSNNNTMKKKKTVKRSSGIRSKVLGSLFGLRYSFQHVVRPGRAINDVGFKIFGLPISVVAGGNFTRIDNKDDVLLQIRKKNETAVITEEEFRFDTAIRIDFESPIMWLGNAKFFPFVLGLGSKAQAPPVTLCTTYMDERIRLALAAGGGRLIFTRGGKTSEKYANDWKIIERKRPVSIKVITTSMAVGVGAALKWIPSIRIPLFLTTTLPMILFFLQKIFRSPRQQQQQVEKLSSS